MKKVKESVNDKFGRSNRYYYINPGKIEDQSDIPENLQEQLASGFSSIGGIITAIGAFDNTGEKQATSELRKRAYKICKKLSKLDSIEILLQSKVPALGRYDVIVK